MGAKRRWSPVIGLWALVFGPLNFNEVRSTITEFEDQKIKDPRPAFSEF